jgi:hypothetical protein
LNVKCSEEYEALERDFSAPVDRCRLTKLPYGPNDGKQHQAAASDVQDVEHVAPSEPADYSWRLFTHHDVGYVDDSLWDIWMRNVVLKWVSGDDGNKNKPASAAQSSAVASREGEDKVSKRTSPCQ